MRSKQEISDRLDVSRSDFEVTLGSFVSVFGTGVLIIGESGCGKSDLALELISRGHALVADDVTEFSRQGGAVVGRAPDRFLHKMNVRDVGIIDVRRTFGENSVEDISSLDVCVELRQREDEAASKNYSILGVSVPRFRFADSIHRNFPLLVETAVRYFRADGFEGQNKFLQTHDESVRGASENSLSVEG